MVEVNNTTKQKINNKKIEKIVMDFLNVYKKSKFEVSVAIIGSARMQSLNNDYRGINKTTDVLSFAGTAPKELGEVIINIEETKKASKYLDVFGVRKPADYILYFLLVHGLLHLIGYEDDREEERLEMLKIGEKFLKRYL